ncbi:MAG: uroporphyrinogen decarboxylase [Maricaulaceae bacterium]|nr:uroporphyrinogen decarboxylase [Maricaulaceae bacterium]
MTRSPPPSFLAVLGGERRDPPPVWLMRQAGRYLPEYRALRARAPSFIDFCLNPEMAAEVTLQPIRRFGFDAAIIFADILLIPLALGRRVDFVAGEGPQLDPLTMDEVAALDLSQVERILAPVGESLRLTRAGLPDTTALIGFAGSPWTVATYMIEGGGSKDRWNARRLAWAEPERFDALMDILATATARYLVMQAQAGAQALKLFDSWAEGLPEPLFERVIIRPTRAIIDAVRAAGVNAPIIGFPRGAGLMYPRYARETGVDAIALDHSIDPAWADAALPPGLPVQGLLDPAVLRAGGAMMDAEIDRIIKGLQGRPHVFNLGHGINPDVPVAHVERMLARIRGGA